MDIEKYIDDYVSWLRSEITFSKIGEYYEVTTPFLNSCNDYMQLYVKQEDNSIYFTDDGYTINGLEMTGITFTGNRKKQLEGILRQYGVVLDGKELTLKANAREFAQRKHSFIQCMMRVDDMYMLSRGKVTSYFLDDIQTFLDSKQIYCTENVQFPGVSGFNHNYDFLMQRSATKPERLCTAINNPSKSTIGNAIFAWDDTKPSRKKDSKLIVLLNDSSNVPDSIITACANYDIAMIKWSEREKASNIDLLSA